MARVLLYDGECGFCTASAGWLRRAGTTFQTVPWQSWPHLDDYGIGTEAVSEMLHLVDGDRVYVGHHAISHTLLGSRHSWARLLGRVVGWPVLEPVAAAAYRWVSAHRSQLPGTTPACSREASR